MEVQDFEMPSPKRQRTNSPKESPQPSLPATGADTKPWDGQDDNVRQPVPADAVSTVNSIAADTAKADGPDMLDFLMQHVESESSSAQPNQQTTVKADANAAGSGTSRGIPTQGTDGDVEMDEKDPLPRGLEPTSTPAIEHLKAVAEINNLPPTADTLAQDHVLPSTTQASATTTEATDLNTTAAPVSELREWETDSSPYDSSDSSDTSSDSSDDDEDDEADEYTLLDPYEQARILMAEDGGGGAGGDSDDEEGGHSRSGNRGGGSAGAGLRTANEKAEDILPKPNIIVTEDMKIEELGAVEGLVENTLLITATTSGEYQVLESGSVLCLGPPARTVIGAVAETLGRVQQPMYTVRFASDTDVRETFGLNSENSTQDPQASIKGTKIFYVHSHSTFVFTQPLKAVKGSDASNFHDEEVGDEEMEFSDDEAEAEHKRQMKQRRKGIDPSTQPPNARGGRGGRGQRGNRAGFGSGRGGNYNHNNSNMHSIPESDAASTYSNGNVEMNYDDVEEGEASMDYTPLKRPETIANGQMSPPSLQSSPPYQQQRQFNNARGNNNRGSHNNSRNRGGGNNRGGGPNSHRTPNFNQNNNNTSYQPFTSPTSTTSMYYNQQPPPPPPQSQVQDTSAYYPSTPQQTAYFGFQPPPPPPYLTPSASATNAIPPSPMTPLPSAGGAYGFSPQTQSQNTQNLWAQYHANMQQAQFGARPGMNAQANVNVNAEALAQVQRQLEELRRAAHGQGQGQG